MNFQKNTGRNVQIFLYVAGEKQNGDFRSITKWNVQEKQREGVDFYVGNGAGTPWGVVDYYQGSFDFEEEKAGQTDGLIFRLRDAKRGVSKVVNFGFDRETRYQSLPVMIVEQTTSPGGSSGVIYTDVDLVFGREVGSKGDKVKRNVTFRAGDARPSK